MLWYKQAFVDPVLPDNPDLLERRDLEKKHELWSRGLGPRLTPEERRKLRQYQFAYPGQEEETMDLVNRLMGEPASTSDPKELSMKLESMQRWMFENLNYLRANKPEYDAMSAMIRRIKKRIDGMKGDVR